jgi:hypothetical protein
MVKILSSQNRTPVYKGLGLWCLNNISVKLWLSVLLVVGRIIIRRNGAKTISLQTLFGRLNYLCNQCLSPLMLWFQIPLMAMCTQYNFTDLRNYWTKFHGTWWSYIYMFLVGPKVFSFVVKGVKVICVVISNPTNGNVYSIQLYVIKYVSDLQQVGGFLWVPKFPPPIKQLTVTIYRHWLHR